MTHVMVSENGVTCHWTPWIFATPVPASDPSAGQVSMPQRARAGLGFAR
jgi:hypothetical protein